MIVFFLRKNILIYKQQQTQKCMVKIVTKMMSWISSPTPPSIIYLEPVATSSCSMVVLISFNLPPHYSNFFVSFVISNVVSREFWITYWPWYYYQQLNLTKVWSSEQAMLSIPSILFTLSHQSFLPSWLSSHHNIVPDNFLNWNLFRG